MKCSRKWDSRHPCEKLWSWNNVPEPTKISNVTAVTLSPTSVKISWATNHPANGKVNWGYEDGIYKFEDQTDKRTSQHEFILTKFMTPTGNLKHRLWQATAGKYFVLNENFSGQSEATQCGVPPKGGTTLARINNFC